MKKFALVTALCALAVSGVFASGRDSFENRCQGGSCAMDYGRDLTPDIPEILSSDLQAFEKVPDVAQYKNADWSNVIGIARNVSLKEACEIANGNPEISFFFHMKGAQMVLETVGGYRVFRKGDAVFFTGTPWWGSAKGFSDGYIKK